MSDIMKIPTVIIDAINEANKTHGYEGETAEYRKVGVCEWSLSKDYSDAYDMSCNPGVYVDDKHEYCPFCGNKITSGE